MKLRKIKLPWRVKKAVLALGPQAKNRLCFCRGCFAYLSRLHADLEEPRALADFEKDANFFLKLKPKIIAYDLHPEYQSSKFASNLSPISHRLSPIQHHHAHIASAMAQNCLKNQKVIGVAFDGTGLGSDDTLWGGEFLLADYRGFRRLARLKEVALIGGETAIKEPWRVAAAWLYQLYGDNFLKLKVPFVRGLDRDKWRLIQKMYLRRINSPLSSSMGRLFDAAAALILNRPKAEFAAQLPMKLEELASHYPLPVSPYAFRIVREKNGYIIDPLPVFRGIVRDLKKDLPRQEIAAKFHLAVAGMITRMCLILSRQARLNKVVLGGGVFQNKLLLGETKELLCKNGLRVFAPEELGADDSVISLGQAVIAAAAT